MEKLSLSLVFKELAKMVMLLLWVVEEVIWCCCNSRRTKGRSCEIYTDVSGIFTTDPRIEPKAKKLEKISYDEMLELASLGAKVLQNRS